MIGLWKWAVDDGSIGALALATLVSAFVLLAIAAVGVTLLALSKRAAHAFATGFRDEWHRDDDSTKGGTS